MQNSFYDVRMCPENSKWEQAISREIVLYNRNNDIRTDFERDYTRILHSQAYRRLKHKTQVFFAPHNDHICTRMEHVLHVASVASTIAKYLGLNEQLASAIAMGHDIGHAPFGHHGEHCLNSLLEQKEGKNAPKKFWHERNSLFFADYIETLQDPDGVEQPLNLTYAVRDGLICHCGEIDQQGIKPRDEAIDLYSIKRPGLIQPFTWEGCVVKIADKIAYLGRDIEDARSYHIIDMSSYRTLREIVGSTLGFENKGAHALKSGKAVNTTVLINDLILDLCEQSSPEKGLCFSDQYFRFIIELKKFNYSHIYNHWRLGEFGIYADNIIGTLYRTLQKTYLYAQNGRVAQALKLYPKLCETFEDWLIKYTNYRPFISERHSFVDKKTILKYNTQTVFDLSDSNSFTKCIIEYISGMTDQFAIQVYEEIISF
ncbi:deoxyguanosinetriphosphate triphosphohydrolase family protein [Treponema sp. Marseille-Q3903]|uniref:deoxyguanosinetriphosphate triphosphohydrolase family protein n=1 Tax=Treponema sp. Marseille-Q3903 TaxID=2766703 RepID=UPI001652AAEE|nr:dNTP triphosphohydrolase [Treponema sp. Marseille-Q3903]MBC6714088.1 dNTP triphosphohydrolase [Treponema sp. Marseille-Q3903]